MKKSTWMMCAQINRLELAWWLAACAGSFALASLSRWPAAEAAPIISMRIDVNHAQLEELLALPGMNYSRARAILQARQKRGEFKTAADLAVVKGLSKAYVNRIAELIELK